MNNLKSITAVLFLIFMSFAGFSQTVPDSASVAAGKYFLVTKNDGVKFTGKIISIDAKEVTIETKNMGPVAIPKHEIKEMRAIEADEISTKGEYVSRETFSTRYFLTTNGLPLAKGDNYVIWNWYGPDFQFGLGKHFGAGVMTSWAGMPIIGSAKYSFDLGKNTHMAVGTLLGTGSWGIT